MGSHHSVGAEEDGGILDLVLMTTMMMTMVMTTMVMTTMMMTMMAIIIYGIKTHITAYRMNN